MQCEAFGEPEGGFVFVVPQGCTNVRFCEPTLGAIGDFTKVLK